MFFHKVRAATPQPNLKLLVQFAEGVTKLYNVRPLLSKWPVFQALEDVDLFASVQVDPGGYGISWNDDIDLSCDELYENGRAVKTPFDGLMALSDATAAWGLNESTLRKAVTYGKLREGTDVQKFGKQWVVAVAAMHREYGAPGSGRAAQE